MTSTIESAKATWNELLDSEVDLVTSNYVVVETMALTQRRARDGRLASILGVYVPPYWKSSGWMSSHMILQ